MTQVARRGSSRILPRDKGAAPLDVVIAIMAFLAALALGASLLAERAAIGWREGLADHLTVQIVPSSESDAEEALDGEATAAVALLRTTRGIAHAAELSNDETAALVEPWLGKSTLIPELPLPKLIDATIMPGTEVDLTLLSRQLKHTAPHAVLDDHRRWIGRLKGLASTVTFSAYGLLVLIAIAMAATVSFATRAGLEAHHEKVELLHQMGAQAGFIARAFERHYLASAFFAGLAGAGTAAVGFALSGGLAFVGVQSVPFLPPLVLNPNEIAWLAVVPAAAAAIAFATARLSVLAALKNIY